DTRRHRGGRVPHIDRGHGTNGPGAVDDAPPAHPDGTPALAVSRRNQLRTGPEALQPGHDRCPQSLVSSLRTAGAAATAPAYRAVGASGISQIGRASWRERV